MHWPRHFFLILLLKAFCQNIKKLNKSSSLPTVVGGASGSRKIAEMWKNHFSNLFNSVGNDEYKEFVCNNITCKNSYTRDFKLYEFIPAHV